ncbi:MAG: hypothetical protein ACRC92_11030 [Peptostreptococcaceae bacterium]
MHKNYGSISHTNTGYNNHTNNNSSQGYGQNHQQYHQAYHNHTNYGNHNNTGYSRGYNNNYNQNVYDYHQSGNHTNTGYARGYNNGYNQNAYGNYSQFYNAACGGCGRDRKKRIDFLKKLNSNNKISGKYLNNVIKNTFKQHSEYYQYLQSGNHTNTGYARGYNNGYNQNYTDYHQSGNHTNTGGYSQSGYDNGYTQAYGQYNQSTGATTHSNTGYTNHVNTTTNVAPTNVSNVSRGTGVYYKSSVNLTWNAATDNNKVISVVSRNTGSGGHADNGIWENTVQKQAAVRSWAGAYWNENGTFGGSIGCDVYGNAAQATTFINWLNSVNSVAKRYVAILGFDEPYTNASAIINQLKSWGFSTLSAADTSHFVFVGITQTGVGVKAQQTVRRYGTSDVRAASCSFTIPGVPSGQTISYYIDYCFKPLGGTYGSWTRIVSGHTGTSYNYSLASHGNGHIKFRVLSFDGVENGGTWVESSEVRVLKYSAPAWPNPNQIAVSTEVTAVKVQIDQLASALGISGTSGSTAYDQILRKDTITSMRNVLNNAADLLSIPRNTDTNLDIIKRSDIDNLKSLLEKV